MRSLLRAFALAVSAAGRASLIPTTAIRSRRAAEAASTLVRRAWCTGSSPLSQTTTRTSSAACKAVKAAV